MAFARPIVFPLSVDERLSQDVFSKRPSANVKSDDPILREAAQWSARAELGTLDAAEFERWRAADPRHALAFIRVTDATQRTAEAASGRQEIRARGVSRRSAIAAGLGALTLGGGGLLASRVSARDRVSTPVGGLRRVDLPSAGALTLNTDSAASWRRERDGLRLWLERGEIGLDLTEGAGPLRLNGEQGGARLSPGRYNARLRDGLLDLTILSGEARAELAGDGAIVRGPHAVLLAADRPLVRAVSSEDLAALGAWRNGEILFVDEPLGQAVDEYNRHLLRKIVIADPTLAGLRVGGRFTADDPAVFLRALKVTQGVDVTTSGEAVFLSRKSV